MCFSATASFVTGGALTAVGTATLRKVSNVKEVPFAAIPLLFGMQQLVEGVVWLSFGFSTTAWNTVMTYVYAVSSHVLWPILIPLAVLLMERGDLRRGALWIFVGVGLSTGFYLLYAISSTTVTSQIVNQSIAYNTVSFYPWTMLVLYLIATCGSCLVSSYALIRLFGLVIFVAFAVAGWFYIETFFSVWCFFAAILSILVYWQMRKNAVLVH